MTAGVSIRNVNKSFGPLRVLADINLDVEPGEFTVLLGPSGCGKSTLLSAVAGLDEVGSGAIFIGGADVTAHEPSERGIAMVFQSYALYPTMTVRRNLSFGLRVGRTPRDEVERRVAWAADLLQIRELLDRKPAALSGGQRQRVAIGRALVRNAQVFLFDEPLSNLDAKLRTEMRIEIKRLHRELGTTILYVTHDQIEAMTLATRIAVMRAGRVEQYATPRELYERPATLFVAGFVGSPAMNFLNGRLVGGQDRAIEIEGRRLSLDGYAFAQPVQDGQPVVLGIRPEHVAVGGDTTDVTLRFIEPMGADTLGWFDLGRQVVSVRLEPQQARGLSGRVPLALDISQASLFSPDTQARL